MDLLIYILSFFLIIVCFTDVVAIPLSTPVYPIHLANNNTDHTYDGHGALSAGASSRLLYDYPLQQRNEILDYLFKPNFGAALDLLKVEIGGDSQSTDGTEASHAHYRNDLNCNRGYEWWLLEEAKKRNPNIITYALSWAVPGWVGNDTYYSIDNINYHISWLKCARDEHPTIGNIDYIGVWNERTWGNIKWINDFRKAMDVNGFQKTKIIIPDGWWNGAKEILHAIDVDSSGTFANSLQGGGIGLHYPCNQAHPEVQSKYNLKYWSSEDYSTEANWKGASCWGRILNQNVVRMNMTSTISWSLIWSVYEDFPYFGNGLMYAMHPWSGHYEVNQAIWTSAHHTQFIEPGWKYIGNGGRGFLQNGGSYVSLVSPEVTSNLMAPNATNNAVIDLTIVVEKLQGDCLRCAGGNTSDEIVTFSLGTILKKQHKTLAVWMTNETVSFMRLPDAKIDANSGIVSYFVGADSIVTLSSLKDSSKGSFKTNIPENTPFLLPYDDDFEERKVASVPKYFSDNGGSFEISSDNDNIKENQYLRQMVIRPPIKNAWIPDALAITVIGESTQLWSDGVVVEVSIRLVSSPRTIPFYNNSSMFGGVCLHVSGGGYNKPDNPHNQKLGHCLVIRDHGDENYFWELQEMKKIIASGPITNNMNSLWNKIKLSSKGNNIFVNINGIKVHNMTMSTNSTKIGRAGLITGWHIADFDDFSIKSM